MSPVLTSLLRLVQRTALFSVASMAMLFIAGAAGTSEPREGSTEESIHAAADHAGAWTTTLAAGGDDAGAAIALPGRDAFALSADAPETAGFAPHSDSPPPASARALPAARGPPHLG